MASVNPDRPVLIATLGTNPQVVTLAVDLLEEDEDVFVDEVYVIHTAPIGRIGAALQRLKQAFAKNQYRDHRCVLHTVLIQDDERQPVVDIRSRQDAHATFKTLYRCISQCKRSGRTIHLSIAGGRNSMVVYGAACAQMLFGSQDCLWHLISTEAFENDKKHPLHRNQKSDAQLAPIPVRPINALMTLVLDAWSAEDPYEVIQAQVESEQKQEDKRREKFLRELTPNEWKVLVDYIQHGDKDRDIAARLYIGVRTVSTHMSHIYDKMETFYSLQDLIVEANRKTLMQWYAGFFIRNPELRQPQ